MFFLSHFMIDDYLYKYEEVRVCAKVWNWVNPIFNLLNPAKDKPQLEKSCTLFHHSLGSSYN